MNWRAHYDGHQRSYAPDEYYYNSYDYPYDPNYQYYQQQQHHQYYFDQHQQYYYYPQRPQYHYQHSHQPQYPTRQEFQSSWNAPTRRQDKSFSISSLLSAPAPASRIHQNASPKQPPFKRRKSPDRPTEARMSPYTRSFNKRTKRPTIENRTSLITQESKKTRIKPVVETVESVEIKKWKFDPTKAADIPEMEKTKFEWQGIVVNDIESTLWHEADVRRDWSSRQVDAFKAGFRKFGKAFGYISRTFAPAFDDQGDDDEDEEGGEDGSEKGESDKEVSTASTPSSRQGSPATPNTIKTTFECIQYYYLFKGEFKKVTNRRLRQKQKRNREREAVVMLEKWNSAHPGLGEEWAKELEEEEEGVEGEQDTTKMKVEGVPPASD